MYKIKKPRSNEKFLVQYKRVGMLLFAASDAFK